MKTNKGQRILLLAKSPRTERKSRFQDKSPEKFENSEHNTFIRNYKIQIAQLEAKLYK